jgi:DNA-3-methyladenine glycosylase II
LNRHPKQNNKIILDIVKPYDFELSIQSMNSFRPIPENKVDQLILAARFSSIPTLVRVSGSGDRIEVSAVPETESSELRKMAEWVLFAELDLKPFYHLAKQHSKLKEMTRKLFGLKPMRPSSLFEMAVIAITEQQISLAAAYRIRSRVVERFGEPIENLWIFPEPQVLASASIEDLQSCGLSRNKAGYIHELAVKITDGTLNLDVLKTMNDDEARETIMNLRGFGRWSADYILIRGLARPDCVPIDDIGIRGVIGEYLGNGSRPAPDEAASKLEPFRPFRGLTAFYLLAAHRLNIE